MLCAKYVKIREFHVYGSRRCKNEAMTGSAYCAQHLCAFDRRMKKLERITDLQRRRVK